MSDIKTTKSPLVVGFMSVAMGLQSPAGHDFVYQTLLRGWFAKTWVDASIDVGRPISFQTFRDNAEILAYDPNPDTFVNNLRLLKDNFSFCLSIMNDTEEKPDIPVSFVACHAATIREQKEDKKTPKPV